MEEATGAWRPELLVEIVLVLGVRETDPGVLKYQETQVDETINGATGAENWDTLLATVPTVRVTSHVKDQAKQEDTRREL